MEEEKKIIAGDPNNFYIVDSGALFGIAFDKIFENEQLEVFNDFEMSSRRNFKNLSGQILETYNELFLDDKGSFNEDYALILYNILNARSVLLSQDSTPYDDFIALIEKIISDGDSLLLKRINRFVDDNYALSLDEATENMKNKKKKVNTELQFSDSHAKTLLKIAYLYRVMIPVISTYFCYNRQSFSVTVKESLDLENPDEIEDLEFDETNSKIFAYLFEKVAKNPKALRNKLYRLTYSRIVKTTYSDKRFWTAAKNVAITKDTAALEIYKKVLTNAIPKFSIEKERNIISFLQSVVNNQIDFLFQNKFKHKFTTINETLNSYGDDDDERLTEFEKMESLSTRKDEGAYLLRKLNIIEVLESLPEKLNVGVSDIEVKEAMKTLNRNSVQEQIVSLLTFKYFNDNLAVKYLNFYQYCYLVLLCKKYLEEHKYRYLPIILTANCEKHRERVNISGKRVRPEILSSKKYNDLFNDRFGNFQDDIEKPFLALVGTTYSSVFKDNDGNELFDSSVKVAKIAEEILDLAILAV